jgi:preprotein translocase subunit Sss1
LAACLAFFKSKSTPYHVLTVFGKAVVLVPRIKSIYKLPRLLDNALQRVHESHSWKSTHDRVVASRALKPIQSEYIRREVVHMMAADIILIFIGIIGLLISFGSLIVALLAYLDRKNKRK